MKNKEFTSEDWSQKYKSSINCSHPKGFSQKAHCAGKKKHNESVEMEMTCEDCGMCKTHGSLNEIKKGQKDSNGFTKCWSGKHAVGTKAGKNGGQVRNCKPNESVDEAANAAQTTEDVTESDLYRILELSGLVNEDVELQFDKIEEWVESLAEAHGVDSEVIWEDFETISDSELLSEAAAWQKSSGKNKNGGLNQKGVNSYKREHPGSKLKTAVTTKPSKLKPGGKAAKRRKSFCARMGGVKGPMKDKNGKPTRKNLALKKWNC
jgi:RecJ-like exonuclease